MLGAWFEIYFGIRLRHTLVHGFGTCLRYMVGWLVGCIYLMFWYIVETYILMMV